MWQYRHTDELYHASDGKERKNHKYVARVKTGNSKNTYRYFYTTDQYNAYLRNKSTSSVIYRGVNTTNTLPIKGKIVAPLKSTSKPFSFKRLVELGKKIIDKLLNRTISKNDKSKVDIGRKTVEDFLQKKIKKDPPKTSPIKKDKLKDAFKTQLENNKKPSKKTIRQSILKKRNKITRGDINVGV